MFINNYKLIFRYSIIWLYEYNFTINV